MKLPQMASFSELVVKWAGRFSPISMEDYFAKVDEAGKVLEIVWKARVSIIASVLLFLILTVPDQSIDVFRVLAENRHSGSPAWDQWVVPLLFLLVQFLLAVTLWFWARVTLEVTESRLRHEGGLKKIAFEWTPRVCGVVPFVTAIVGFSKAYSRSNAPYECIEMAWYSAISMGYFAVTVFAKVQLFPGDLTEKLGGAPSRGLLGRTIKVFTAFVTVGGIALGLLFTYRPYVSNNIGTLTVIYFGFIFWTVAASALVWIGRLIRLPLLTILFCWALILAWLDVNDNHQLLSSHQQAEIIVPSGSTVLSNWLGSRPRSKTAPDPAKLSTPVIIIAAEGGGIYAAYHTAYLLGAIQDRFPAFRRHIFAISGVSGGSVGATAFAQFCAWDDAGSNWSLSPNRRTAFRQASRSVFRTDYLEPVMAMALFPDLFQRFLPFPIRALDRARGLEQCYEYALSTADKNHRDPTPFYDLTSNFSQRSVPALFLNTTQVDSGGRMVITNLATSTVYDEDPKEPIGFKTLHHLAPNESLPQSSAAFASARFPYITPVAYMLLNGPDGTQKHEFADGGYFENSALATTADLLHLFNLRLHAGNSPSVRLVVIRIGTDDTVSNPDNSFNEALAPIRTLFNTRNARGENALVQARRAVQDLQNIDGVPAQFIPFQLNVTSQKIPLGWVLSSSSCDAIESQVDDELNKSGEIREIGMLLRGDNGISAK